MNSLSIFSPAFTDSILDAFDKSFQSNLGVFAPAKANAGLPSVDIREVDSAYIMEADLPGFSEKDIDISIKDRVMTLSSLKEAEKESEEKADYIIRERNVTHFIRRFSLPEDIDSEKVTADFENGVLTVNIPRRAEAQPRQITINRK